MEEVIGIQNGISIDALVNTGVTFDVNNIQDAINDIITGDDDDDDMAEGVSSEYFDPLGKFVKEPFNKLWEKMEPIDSDDLVRKLIVKEGSGESPMDESTLKIFYCGYFDGQSMPFMSNKKHQPWAFHLKDSGLLPGMDIAIRSMTVREQSRFLIHHSLMYGKLGCPPHIPKEAMCLIHFVLLSSTMTSEVVEEISGGLPKILSVLEKAKNLYKDGVFYFNCNNYNNAISSFNKALRIALNTRLADSQEEKIQKDFLSKIFLNMAICYNAKKLPLKVCSMCNEYGKIYSIWKNWRVLFQYGKAYIMMGCFVRARRKLNAARRLNPTNQEIINMMKVLDEKESVYKKYEMQFSKFILMVENSDSEVDQNVLADFENEIQLLCSSIKNDEEIKRMELNLPLSFSTVEMNVFKKIVTKNKLSLEFNDDKNTSENKHVVIIKDQID